MLGTTHLTLGMASALIVTHPQTVSGVFAAIVGGGIGGWIVDVDCKNKERNSDTPELDERESIYNGIINAMVIGAFIAVDFFAGNGMCQYVISNWGIQIWGALLGLAILLLIGFNSRHRTFTHSFVGMALFSTAVYFFCRPAAVPFALGYLSHIIADIFNKKGLQLFFPLKWGLCLKLCYSANKTVNRILFWASFLVDVILGAFLFWNAITKSGDASVFISLSSGKSLFGLNLLQIYLIFINIATFCGVQRSWTLREREVLAETDERIRIGYEFEIWLLNILCLLGGGPGMLTVLVIHRAFPVEYNGVWWSFCCASTLFWSAIYCYICDPFGWQIQNIHWLSLTHIPFIVYILGINTISALVIYSLRKRRISDNSMWHTLIWLTGALGGTFGAILMALRTHRENSFFYVKVGFPIMLIGQIVFCLYMMAAGIF